MHCPHLLLPYIFTPRAAKHAARAATSSFSYRGCRVDGIPPITTGSTRIATTSATHVTRTIATSPSGAQLSRRPCHAANAPPAANNAATPAGAQRGQRKRKTTRPSTESSSEAGPVSRARRGAQRESRARHRVTAKNGPNTARGEPNGKVHAKKGAGDAAVNTESNNPAEATAHWARWGRRNATTTACIF